MDFLIHPPRFNWIHGTEGRNSLHGTDQDDFILGYGGNDTLMGRQGRDMLSGGAGADHLDGGLGRDAASYGNADSAVSVSLESNFGQWGDAQGDTFTSIEDIFGSAFNDLLTGNGADNFIHAGDGDDYLNGRAGKDELNGGNGNDWLFGGDGADELIGGAGNDTLAAEGAADILEGGTGADVFKFYSVYDSAGAAHDTIRDFNRNEGAKIDLSSIDAKVHTAGNQGFSFVGESDFYAEGQVNYYHMNGNTYVEANIMDYDGAEMQIELQGIHDLTWNDFIL
jgi:Ca2+-binding RTX toxin-like protein